MLVALNELVAHKQKKRALEGKHCQGEAKRVGDCFWDGVLCGAALEQVTSGWIHVFDSCSTTWDVSIGIAVQKNSRQHSQ
jgi:hypothetical protein